MTIQQTNLIAALAGGVGLALVGYCFYFDHKRRSHPDFRKNLIESTNQIIKLTENQFLIIDFKERRSDREKEAQKNSTQYPDLLDEKAVQQFFMKEIALGEQLLGLGDIENGIEHLANAVTVTVHKENLLNMLKSSLPDPIFALLVQRLPVVSKVMKKFFSNLSTILNTSAFVQKIYASYQKYSMNGERYEPKITEIYDEDVEGDEEDYAEDNDAETTDQEDISANIMIDDLLD